ncbi:hypothetical protein ACWEOP_27430 [Streptomyces chartreusis]
MNRLRKATTWALPVALTVIAVVWAVAAIGDILTAQAHPAFAYSVAVLYDAVWLYGLAMETAHRRQGSSARLPQVIGWVFLPLTVAILAAHGALAGDVLAAVVGALIPVLAKMTLVMAVDRDTTRISSRAQAAINRTRAVTRDRIAVSRALAQARADETKAAADIVKRSKEAEADAAVTTFEAFEAYTETLDQHPVPDWHTDLPALVPDRELEALLAGGVPDDEPAEDTEEFEAAPQEKSREENDQPAALPARPRPEVVPAGARMLPLVARPEAPVEQLPKLVTPSLDDGVFWLPSWRYDLNNKATASVPAEQAREVVTEVVALSPSDLRRKARALNRQAVRSTNRPVTIDTLRTELGLSRREAAELRREVVITGEAGS